MTQEPEQTDPVEQLLRAVPTSDRVRAAAWDAVYQSADDADLEQRLKMLPLPDDTKAALWEFRAKQQSASSGKPLHPYAKLGNEVVEFGKRALQLPVDAVKGVDALGRALIPEVVGNALGFEPGTTGPINALTAAGQASIDATGRARAAFGRGDITEGVSRSIGAVPFVGPPLEAAGDKMMEGRYGEGLGDAFNLGMLTFGPAIAANARANVPATVKPRLNASEQAAVQYGESRGIPIDAGTATGSQWVRNLQKRVASQPGGANRAEGFRSQHVQALEREAQLLAERANQTRTGRPGAPENAASAGEAVSGRLESRINAQARVADSAYTELRALEAQQAQTIAQHGGVQAPATSQRAFTNQPLAVDVAASKTALRPLYEQLKREQQLVGTLQGGKARTLVALDNLMNGPDLAPLSVVDGALGDLKAMARTNDLPALRTQGQATAAEAVKALEAQVTATARAAGPDVFNALQRGRQATIGKYETAAVRDTLNINEPVQVFRQLTQAKDVGLERLRAVAQQTPREIPKVARAYLEGLIDEASREGGFAHADRLWADWSKLGPETKAILFRGDRALIKDLDNFFLLAKKVAENPNPSGTAPVLTAVNVGGVPVANVLARMLYTRKGVRALTQGFQVALGPRSRTAARGVSLGELTKVAREVMAEPSPAFADESEPSPAPGLDRRLLRGR